MFTPHRSTFSHLGQNSIESPYTSIGSAIGSAQSIKPKTKLNYEPLRTRSRSASHFREHKSKAVMEALGKLQEKIKRLEIDRVQAEDNLKCLTSETNEYKDMLNQKQLLEQSASNLEDTHSKVLEGQLGEAEKRCRMLESQLDNMRRIIQNENFSPSPRQTTPGQLSSAAVALHQAESPSACSASLPPYNPTKPKSAMSSRYTVDQMYPSSLPASTTDFVSVDQNTGQVTFRPSAPSASTRQQVPTTIPVATPSVITESPALEKLSELEREHIKLTASQTAAEEKIRDLEEKIREEKHHRKLLQDKAKQLQSAVDVQLSEKPLIESKEKKKCRKKKKPSGKSKPIAKPSGKATPVSPSHYHLDVAHIPFVVGQSTTKSHSLGANIQNVMSIMKGHNKLCNGDGISLTPSRVSKKKSVSSAESGSTLALDGLLSTLEEEFSRLGLEHEELNQQIQETVNANVRADLERELEKVVGLLDAKGRQVQTLRNHKKKLKQKEEAHKAPSRSIRRKTFPTQGSKEIEVVTTIRAVDSPAVTSSINPNLQILKKVKKLQTTLLKDDLSWE